jgi:large subunit ribosomal protein L29
MALKDTERKPIKPAQLEDMTAEDLREELARLRETRFRMKFRSATEAMDNPSQFRILRRNIARIETALRQRKQA